MQGTRRTTAKLSKGAHELMVAIIVGHGAGKAAKLLGTTGLTLLNLRHGGLVTKKMCDKIEKRVHELAGTVAA